MESRELTAVKNGIELSEQLVLKMAGFVSRQAENQSPELAVPLKHALDGHLDQGGQETLQALLDQCELTVIAASQELYGSK